MIEEVEESVPVFLSFNDLSVKINDRQILQNVSGKVHPGEMLAIMGPSGSGKTTLLNILAGRLSPGSGEILLNGTKLNKKVKKKICYVLQEDTFFAHLTLQETLTFSAMLRLPDTLSKDQKLQKVEEIVEDLDIRKCLHTKIGSPFERGLSGGEKKRANIGCELITNPSLIFLDEPTSGLDSSNALNLVSTLKKIAQREKKTVVTSIHQPSSQIFYMFDKVLLMCGGQVAYYGKARKVLDYFESIGLCCEPHFNPADFILEKVSEGEKVENMIVSKWADRQSKREKSLWNETPKLENRSPSPESSEEDEWTKANALKDEPLKVDISSDITVENTREAKQDVKGKEDTVDNSDLEDSLRRSELDGQQLSSEANAISAPLIPHSSLSHLRNSWRSHTRSISKSSHHDLSPVHTEAQVLSSTDFSVAVVAYKRQTSQDYTKVDVNAHDDDDHSELYEDIPTSWATSFWTQFTVLMGRTFQQSKPDILSKLSLIQSIMLAVVTALIWFQTPYVEESIADRYALLFFTIVYWTFNPLFQSLFSFPNERTVVNKERASGYYRLSAYYLAKVISELPLVILQPTLYLTIVYWAAGLNKSESFLTMLFLVLLTTVAAQSVGLFIGALVMDFKKSIVIAALYAMTSMLLGGFYQKNIPSWLQWFQYLSYLTYCYEAALTTEFTTSPPFRCLEVDSAYAACKNNGTVIPGRDVLVKLKVTRSAGENVAVILLFIAFFRLMTYCCLRYLNKPK
ncbi:ABC transporter G family member 14-like [Acropora millepora]|uniref:ABC transporter G family member 14-like n=1 Tax=Acropora millepora TaxID=45264 RepID=UPI001CF1DA07|nr:ABC transporter G family member 14-like [Acropora millepora]